MEISVPLLPYSSTVVVFFLPLLTLSSSPPRFVEHFEPTNPNSFDRDYVSSAVLPSLRAHPNVTVKDNSIQDMHKVSGVELPAMGWLLPV